MTIRIGDIPNKTKVYSTFKKEFSLSTKEELENILYNLRKYSDIYKFFINPENVTDKEIRTEVEYIKYIEINVSYPFLLQVFDDYKNNIINKSTLLNVLRFVQTYACRRFILDLPTNALNKIFMNLYKQIDVNNYENSLFYYILTRSGKVRMPSDLDICNYLADKDLYNARSRMKLYILERLENFNNKEKVEIIGNSNITIEHIFPQRPELQWKSELTESEYKEFSEKYIHTIGNLTLSGNNGSLGNKTFIEKKLMNKDSGEQGYIYSRLWLNRFLKDIDNWNISNYRKRTDILVKRFLKIWALPADIKVEEIPEMNISNIDHNNVTNKEIEYAVFFDKILSGDKYKGIKLYNYILKELFSLYPEEEFIRKFRSILRLTEEPNELHRCQALNSTYYYDTNLSYSQMFSNLKKILEQLGISDELSIKIRDRK